MLEVFERILNALTPLLVAVTAAGGGILVAKINKIKTQVAEASAKVSQVQTDIVTNHGSKNIGDAIDRLTTHVFDISAKQDQLILDVAALKDHDTEVDSRLDHIEQSSQETKDAVTDSIRVVKPFRALIDRLKG